MFTNLSKNIIAYMPNLFGGIVLLIIGWILGWLAKRFIIQIAVILKLERFLISFRWGKGFTKADIRYGFYNYLGNIVFFVIFIIFFNDALSTFKLTIFSTFLERVIFYVPKILISLIIMGIGWFIAGWGGRSVQRVLNSEGVPKSALIAQFVKTVLFLFFAAMALVELDIAREIVVIGFATIFISLGLFTVVLAAVGGKEFIKKIEDSFGEN
jgi:hypothetical protein